ncbi:MAG: 50S ribosomal protein L3 [Planctomycetota bacterium]|nr:MAG: 50S ribosomal protein L3 [Planctomycetota bacterium]
MERLKLLGRKIGMTTIFREDGSAIPVTLLEVGPCFVVQVRTKERDGYDAVQIGFERKKEKHCTKPLLGHFKKAGVPPLRFLREVKLKTSEHSLKSGQVLTVEAFEGIRFVDVSGRSKGRGFAGTIKRWGFRRGPQSHGSQNVRRSGAIGQCMTPGRVFKGKKMAGRYGGKRVTVRNLEVVEIIPERNILVVKGAVPGPNGGFVEVQRSLID